MIRALGRGALAAVILAGCATSPVFLPVTPELQLKGDAHQRRIKQLTAWSFNGRIAAQNGDNGWSGTVRWLQEAQDYDIVIQGPVGSGSVRLRGNAGHSALYLPDNQTFTGDNAEQLLEQHFGWHIPVDALQQWMVGRPDPKLKYDHALDDSGRLQRLRQSGWDVEYKQYARVGDDDLPEKIFVRGKQTQVRLFIDEWTSP